MSDFSVLIDLLPPVFFRSHLSKLTKGLINGRTIANLQSSGVGPDGFYLGTRMAFERTAFIAWLQGYSVARRRILRKTSSFATAGSSS